MLCALSIKLITQRNAEEQRFAKPPAHFPATRNFCLLPPDFCLLPSNFGLPSSVFRLPPLKMPVCKMPVCKIQKTLPIKGSNIVFAGA